MTNDYPLSHAFIESLAGFVAGAASTLVTHPLDLVKTRLQGKQLINLVNSSNFSSWSRIRYAPRHFYSHGERSHSLQRRYHYGLVSWVIAQPGGQFFELGSIFCKLWQGEEWDPSISWAKISAFVLRLLPRVWGCRYCFRSLPNDPRQGSNFRRFTGTLTALFSNPIWVIKTRMLSTSSNYPGAYTSIADGARQIFRSEGLRGFYNGLVPSLFGVSHGALQFMAYEKLKLSRKSSTAQQQRDLSTFDFLLLSGLAKIFAAVVSYPYQVIRARLQIYDAGKAYKGSRDVVAQVWRHEGIKGFYKGLAPNLLRVMPSTCVTFLVYENTRLQLPGLLGGTITTWSLNQWVEIWCHRALFHRTTHHVQPTTHQPTTPDDNSLSTLVTRETLISKLNRLLRRSACICKR